MYWVRSFFLKVSYYLNTALAFETSRSFSSYMLKVGICPPWIEVCSCCGSQRATEKGLINALHWNVKASVSAAVLGICGLFLKGLIQFA